VASCSLWLRREWADGSVLRTVNFDCSSSGTVRVAEQPADLRGCFWGDIGSGSFRCLQSFLSMESSAQIGVSLLDVDVLIRLTANVGMPVAGFGGICPRSRLERSRWRGGLRVVV
jgi:hypothetical protein